MTIESNQWTEEQSNEIIKGLANVWADTNKPQKEKENQGGDAQADKLVKFVFENPTIILFHDELNIPYVRFSLNGHNEIFPLDSSSFKRWLSKSYYDQHKKTLNQNILTAALQTIAGRACFDGEAIKLHTRTAKFQDSIWYDLADANWRTVNIYPGGWAVEANSPIIFKRQQHQAEQVEPESGGNIRDILKFVNITDETQKILFLVLLVSYFIPGFPHPIAYVYGPQGSAKSSLSRIVRKLVDPSRIEVLSLPKKEEELVQVLSHHYYLFFDNVGTISDSVSDLLCRAVTGSGFSKRQLYSNDEDIIYSIQANMGINGINLSSRGPDMLERSILFELRRVKKTERRQERELIEQFENERSKIMGAIFDILGLALAIKPTVRVASLPRMADFALWGCAISEAMGVKKEVFLNAYTNNIESQNAEVLGEHIEAELLCAYMEDREEWTGSMSDLYEALKPETRNSDGFPKSANALSRQLNTLKINLEEAGINIVRNKGTRRTITIRNILANIVTIADIGDASETSHADTKVIQDDMSGLNLEPSLNISEDESEKDGKDDSDDTLHDF